MRRRLVVLGLCSVIGLTIVAALLPNGSHASSSETTFLVPSSDGYGVAECLTSGAACGNAVATTWCEAQGYSHAVSFRPLDPDEITGSIQTVGLSGSKDRPIAITCSD